MILCAPFRMTEFSPEQGYIRAVDPEVALRSTRTFPFVCWLLYVRFVPEKRYGDAWALLGCEAAVPTCPQSQSRLKYQQQQFD